MKTYLNYFLLLYIFLMTSAFAAPTPIRVGIPLGYEPITYLDENGIPRGIAVDLWEEIAKENHWDFAYVKLTPDMGKNWQAVRDNQIDVLLGPVTVDTDVSKVTLSLPFFMNPISAVVLKKPVSFRELLSGAISNYLGYIIIAYLSFFFLYINLIWAIEYLVIPETSKNEGKIVPKNYLQGLWFILYHHFTFSDHFFDVQKTHISRTIYAFWVYATFAFMTILGATLTALLTTASIGNANTEILTKNSLQKKSFAYMDARPFYKEFVKHHKIHGVPVNNMEEAIRQLRTHQIDGIINTQILVDTYLKEHHIDDMDNSPYSLGYLFYCIGLSLHSPYVEQINKSIVNLQRSGVLEKICLKYNITESRYSNFY